MPYDNAMSESFFSTLKLELIPEKAFALREAARLAVFDYIEAFYNRPRMQSALDYQSPDQYEKQLNRLGMCLRLPARRNRATPLFTECRLLTQWKTRQAGKQRH